VLIAPGGGLVPRRWGYTMPQDDGVGTQRPIWTTPISGHGHSTGVVVAAQYINNGIPGTTQTLEPCAANPGLVTHRRTV